MPLIQVVGRLLFRVSFFFFSSLGFRDLTFSIGLDREAVGWRGAGVGGAGGAFVAVQPRRGNEGGIRVSLRRALIQSFSDRNGLLCLLYAFLGIYFRLWFHVVSTHDFS